MNTDNSAMEFQRKTVLSAGDLEKSCNQPYLHSDLCSGGRSMWVYICVNLHQLSDYFSLTQCRKTQTNQILYTHIAAPGQSRIIIETNYLTDN